MNNILKIILFSLLIAISYATSAQKVDSIWYDKKWKETSLPQEHYYLRTIKPLDGVSYNFEVIDHYPNGKIQMKGFYSSIKPEIKNGEFHYYSDNGVLTTKNIWINNLVAETFSYDMNGKQTQHIIKSEYLATLSATEKLDKYGLKSLDKHPEFPGGEDSFKTFIAKNLVYPPKALIDTIQGRVIVSATIDESGNLKKIKIVQAVHPLLDGEALRVAKLLPKKRWIPAQDKGKSVSADFTFPIMFRL